MSTTYGNAHTADYYIKASRRTIEHFMQNHIQRLIKTDSGFYMNYLDVTFIIKTNSNYITMTVDFIKLLKKPDISTDDVDVIENILTNIISQIHPFVYSPVLSRIDLRYDLELSDVEKLQYFKLWEKTTLKRGTLKKLNPEEFKRESLYYTSESQYESVRVNIYDKEKERINKGKTPEDFEENILRFEIQLFNRHLNYMKKNHGIDKNIDSYLSDEMLGKYLDKYLSPIIFSSTYRSLQNSYDIINKSELSHSMKSKLKKCLRLCDKEEIDAAKSRFTTNTWNGYIKQLEDMDINPIPLNKNMSIDFILNPISKHSLQRNFEQNDVQRRRT